MLHQLPLLNRHAPSETDMSDRQPIGDRYACSETDMPDQGLTFMPNRRHIGDQHALSKTHQKPTCLIRVLTLFQYTYINAKSIYI